MRFIAFDIETGAAPLSKLKEILPPWDPSTVKNPGTFNPSAVKLGNTKDQKLIDEKIFKASEAHSQAVADYELKLRTGEADYWKEIEEQAALSALTCEVLAIGFQGNGSGLEKRTWYSDLNSESEKRLLRGFWRTYQFARENDCKIVGFYSSEFDVPVLAQRSILLGVDVPKTVLNGRYLDSTFVDLATVWKFGARESRCKLDTLAKALGLSGKLPGVTGAQFAKLFRSSDPEEVKLAKAYFEQDIEITFGVADRLL